MRKLTAFGCGLLFGIGLLLAGMINPAKVQGFLDLAGAWDPSLALVMAAAIAVALPLFRLAEKRSRQEPVCWPDKRRLDRRLVLGSLLFGVGWGLAGICPGPGVAALLTGHWQAWVFMAGMSLGMAVPLLLTYRSSRPKSV